VHEALPTALKRLQSGNRFVLAGLGDSLTKGWMVSRGFFDRFVDGLEGTFEKAEIERINDGVPGSTAAEGLRRLGHLLQSNPELVLVQFGLNDCFSGVPIKDFLDAYGQMMNTILQEGRVPLLLTSCPVQDSEFDEAVLEFYSGILKLGRMSGVPVADLATFWREHEREYKDALYQFDGFHPTDSGHDLMARGLLRFFTGNDEGTA